MRRLSAPHKHCVAPATAHVCSSYRDAPRRMAGAQPRTRRMAHTWRKNEKGRLTHRAIIDSGIIIVSGVEYADGFSTLHVSKRPFAETVHEQINVESGARSYGLYGKVQRPWLSRDSIDGPA